MGTVIVMKPDSAASKCVAEATARHGAKDFLPQMIVLDHVPPAPCQARSSAGHSEDDMRTWQAPLVTERRFASAGRRKSRKPAPTTYISSGTARIDPPPAMRPSINPTSPPDPVARAAMP